MTRSVDPVAHSTVPSGATPPHLSQRRVRRRRSAPERPPRPRRPRSPVTGQLELDVPPNVAGGPIEGAVGGRRRTPRAVEGRPAWVGVGPVASREPARCARSRRPRSSSRSSLHHVGLRSPTPSRRRQGRHRRLTRCRQTARYQASRHQSDWAARAASARSRRSSSSLRSRRNAPTVPASAAKTTTE